MKSVHRFFDFDHFLMIESYKDDHLSFMNKKKYSRYKNIFRDDDINSFEPTDEQKLLFKQTYQKLYQTSPFDNPNEFCEYLNQLTELLQKASSIFKYNEELQDPQLIKNIISLLNTNDNNLLYNIILFLDELLVFNCPLIGQLLETNIIESIVKIFENNTIQDPNFINVLLNIFGSLSQSNRCWLYNDAPEDEGLQRIFQAISINEIYQIVLQSERKYHSNYECAFSTFLYNISGKELNEEIQNFILVFILEKYNENNQDLFFCLIWTLYKMSKNKLFSIKKFYEMELHTFVVDLINIDDERYVFPSLQIIINLCNIKEPNDFNIPKIRTDIYSRIFEITQDLEGRIFSDKTRAAAFDSLRFMITTFKHFQRFENNAIPFLANQITTIQFIFENSGFQIKYSIISFINQLLISGSNFGDYYSNSLFIQDLIKNKIIMIFMDALELENDQCTLSTLVGMNFLIKQCDKYGIIGVFEMEARDTIEIQKIIDLIDNGNSQEIKQRAAILHSSLLHLPNKSFATEND